jgi:hypothetical protein
MRKIHTKVWWAELAVLFSIIFVCILGSRVPGAKAQDPVVVGECEAWVKVPAPVRIQILRLGLVTEMIASNLGEGSESLIDCLSEHEHMVILDGDIMTECLGGGDDEDLEGVFDRSLERLVFRCLKWVHEEENFEIDGKKQGAKGIE